MIMDDDGLLLHRLSLQIGYSLGKVGIAEDALDAIEQERTERTGDGDARRRQVEMPACKCLVERDDARHRRSEGEHLQAVYEPENSR